MVQKEETLPDPTASHKRDQQIYSYSHSSTQSSRTVVFICSI